MIILSTLTRTAFGLAISMALTSQTALAQQESLAFPTEPGTPLNTDHFDGYETWPLVSPGDREVDNSALENMRIELVFLGPGSEENVDDPQVMRMDVTNIYFHGEPAMSIEWMSTGSPGEPGGTAVPDVLYVDKATHRILHRIQTVGGPPSDDWIPPLAIMTFQDDIIHNTLVNADGTTEHTSLETSEGTIDFATLQFWLPFLDLEPGMSFQVPYYRRASNEISPLPLHVVDKARVTDYAGRQHEAWRIQTISRTGGTLIELWIKEEAPYFLGYEFRNVETGDSLIAFRYRDHIILDR